MEIDQIRQAAEKIADQEKAQYQPGNPPQPDKEKPDRAAVVFESKKVIESLNRNQRGDAEIFAASFAGLRTYDHASGLWYRWGGHYWVEDRTEGALRDVEHVAKIYEAELDRVSREINEGAKSGGKPDKGLENLEKSLRKRVSDLRTHSRISYVLNLCRGDPRIATDGEQWDKNDMLLAVPNGVIDLTTGTLRPGRPDDMIRTALRIEYQGIDAPCPAWERFLLEIFQGNQQVVGFIQRFFGYSVTGLTIEGKTLILYGIGRNGKSILCGTIAEILGNYAKPQPVETLLESRNEAAGGAPRSDLVEMRGIRLLVAMETAEGRRYNISKIKLISGGDKIEARGPHEKRSIRFKNTAKLILGTNYKPRVKSSDYAMWKRILLVPFRLSFVKNPTEPYERKDDEKLPEKFQAELCGILGWLIRGCLDWQKQGLNPPDEILASTKKYQEENDFGISDFLRECCRVGPSETQQAGPLYSAYEVFARESGTNPIHLNGFTEEMLKKFDRYTKGHKKFYIGVRLFDTI